MKAMACIERRNALILLLLFLLKCMNCDTTCMLQLYKLLYTRIGRPFSLSFSILM